MRTRPDLVPRRIRRPGMFAGGDGSTLSLDFTSMSGLDSRFTFSRSSTATVINSSGLVQLAENNLLVHSENMTNNAFPGWGTRNNLTSVTSGFTAPDGSTNAVKIVANATSGTHYLGTGAVTISNGITYTMSCFVKPSGYGIFGLVTTNSQTRASFDLAGNTSSGYGITNTRTITPYANGWYRVTMTWTASTASVEVWLVIQSTVQDPALSWSGNATDGVQVWGAQLNQGAADMPYNRTTTTAYHAPRFDYDPTTLAPRGLLLEGSVTNELARSNEFSTSPWYTTNFNTPTVASPAVTDPAGGTNTWYCVPSGSGSVLHGFRYNTTFTAVAYTFSIWAKAAQHDKFIISDGSSGQGACRFDLTAKTANVIVGIVTPTNPQIVEYPNGWFRCSFTMVMAAATRGMTYSSYPTGASLGAFGATFTATGTDGMYFYGAQTEIAAGPSSYIPTGASTVQRALEVCSMTGTNFSSWYTQGVGTVLVFSDINFPNTSQNVNFLIQDATAQNYARAGHKVGGGTAEALLTATSASIQGFADTAFIPSNTIAYKTCYAWEANNFAAVANNGTVGIDTTGLAPGTVDRMFIGGDGTNSIHAKQGHIAKLVYWPTRLPNATLQSLTA